MSHKNGIVKKKLFELRLSALIGLSFTALTSGQTLVVESIKVGANVSKIMSESPYFSYDLPKPGAALGISFIYPINTILAIRPELFYSMKGGRAEDGLEECSNGRAMNLNYVEFPILAVLSATENLKVVSGPYAGFFLNGKTWEYLANGEVIENTNYRIGRNQISSPDYGLVSGIQISLRKIPYLSIYHFDIRYSLGLSNNVQ